MVITKFDTKLGDKFITKSGDHQICHKISHKIWWKIGQQFVNYIQWHISHRIFGSPNLSPYFAPNLVFTHFGDKCITKFGDKFGDHQIWHLIRWQSCHQIWWTPNLSPNNSPNLVTNVSPNWVLTEFVTKFVTKFVTEFGEHRICHQIWWQIRHQICHQPPLDSFLDSPAELLMSTAMHLPSNVIFNCLEIHCSATDAILFSLFRFNSMPHHQIHCRVVICTTTHAADTSSLSHATSVASASDLVHVACSYPFLKMYFILLIQS